MKGISIKRFECYLLYLLSIHMAALFIFFIFRFTLFCSIDYQFPAEIKGDVLLQSGAFLRGLWFDNVIACYILLLPLVVLWIAALCNYTAKWLFRFTTVYFSCFYSVSFVIAAANIPYFEYFFKTINSSIYNWFGYGGTTAGLMFGESSYYFPIFLGLLSIVAFVWGASSLASYFYRRAEKAASQISLLSRVAVLVAGAICIGLCLFGIRGRMGYNPIKVSQAYYCEDPFLNQLGVNPVFNLLTSTLDDNRKENRTLHLMSEEDALSKVQKYLHRQGIDRLSPIARKVEREGTPNRRNVVLVFMESMSANLMGTFGSDKKLTPYLDSLYQQSLSFSHFYSSGIHTNHGIYSTLYSFPAIMKRNAMKGSVIPVYSGLPTVLQENGYCNLFFMTHESQYDNMNAFLRTNGFDEIYAQENYPSEKVVNSFGVQDDFMYQYALPILNERAGTGNPFFCVLLSISNHPPYVIPPYFHPHSDVLEEQIVEYADWSIRQFMQAAEKQPWFDNTIFVFLGAHGKMVGTPECEMPQSYNHIPLMIYGKDIKPGVYDGFGGQVDVSPTLLGLLNISYLQNNFGVNLLEEERPCMFFTADNLIGARDSVNMFIYSPDSQQEFKYKLEEGKLHAATGTDEEAFRNLKDYCFSMLQSTESLVKEHKTLDKVSVKK